MKRTFIAGVIALVLLLTMFIVPSVAAPHETPSGPNLTTFLSCNTPHNVALDGYVTDGSGGIQNAIVTVKQFSTGTVCYTLNTNTFGYWATPVGIFTETYEIKAEHRGYTTGVAVIHAINESYTVNLVLQEQ